MQTFWAFLRNVFKNSAIISTIIIAVVVAVVVVVIIIKFNFKSTTDNI